jgi:hypothetical protein
MLDKLLPPSLDNRYRGYKAALWMFGFVVAIRMVQSTMIIFNGYATVRDADGIPLDSYPADASQTIRALFAQSSLWRMLLCLLGILVLVRYRSAVALMFVLFIVNFLAAQLLSQFLPMVKTGTPPGPIVNLILFGIMIIGLGLSLTSPRAGD